MTWRQLPGALILGLLASLVAHAAGFGGDHVTAGAFHELQTTLAFAGAAGGLVAALWTAFASAGGCAQGSIVACRLSSLIPRARVLAACGTVWFALMESVEPAHGAASVVTIACAMLLAAFMLRLLAVFAARLIAVAVLVIARVLDAPRPVFVPRRYVAPVLAPAHRRRRIVTRPPPRYVLIPG